MVNASLLEQTQANVPETDAWLSAHEIGRLSTMRFPKRRADWRLGRWTAKHAVALFANKQLDPKTLAGIEIRTAASGAPEVWLSSKPAEFVISISHRVGHAICAISEPGMALGCDLELVEPRSDGFLVDYFVDEEQALVANAPLSERPRLAALLWSAKESALKAMRVGLRLDTRRVVVSQLEEDGHGVWRALRVRCDGGQVFHGWWQQTGCFVRTLVADIPIEAPILFDTRTEPTDVLSFQVA